MKDQIFSQNIWSFSVFTCIADNNGFCYQFLMILHHFIHYSLINLFNCLTNLFNSLIKILQLHFQLCWQDSGFGKVHLFVKV